MDKQLSDIYVSQVRPKGDISRSSSSIFGATYERDPNFSNLEATVFSKIQNLIEEPRQSQILPDYKNNNLVRFSVEDAIKELKELNDI